MAISTATTTIALSMLEDPVGGTDDASSLGPVMASVWTLMPQDLVQTVLLFLPAPIQARFRCVCRRWRRLLSSLEFREETALTALRLGYPSCSIESEDVSKLELSNWLGWHEKVERFKVRKVDFRGLGLPRNFYKSGRLLSTGTSSGVPQVLLSCPESENTKAPGKLRCWLLNLANQTWRELPVLDLVCGEETAHTIGTRVFVVQEMGCDDFEVVVMHQTYRYLPEGSRREGQEFELHTHLHTLPTTSNDWRPLANLECGAEYLDLDSVHAGELGLVSGRGYAVLGRDPRAPLTRLSWEGEHLCPLPRPPEERFIILSCQATSSVFAHCRSAEGFSLYRFDESTGDWECLFSGQLPPGMPKHVVGTMLDAQIIGNVILTLARIFCDVGETRVRCRGWAMAYHMLEGSCKWFRTGLGLSSSRLQSSFLSPTILAHVTV